jgi:hypothetical protein
MASSFRSYLKLICLASVLSLQPNQVSRRTLLARSILPATCIFLPSSALASDEVSVFKTPSGLRYIDLVEGDGPTPAYGQLVTIQYTSYVTLPSNSKNASPKPQQFDSQASYLLKHGNGRMIAGLDEGLHTLKVGGKRRLLIPPKLGFVDSGLGPMPPYPWQRFQLNNMLDQMVAMQGGTLVMEVRLLGILDDEADQGYYQDDSLTPEDFETLKSNLQRKITAAKAAAQQS